METAEALKKFADRYGIESNKELGKIIGKAPNTVSEILSLNGLSENIRKKVLGDKRFALRELKKIATKSTPKAQEKLFTAYEAKIEAESLNKATRVRLKGADLHIKKIMSMQDYFAKLAADDKIMDLHYLSSEMVGLKVSIENILSKFEMLNPKIDASNVVEESYTLTMTESLGSGRKKKKKPFYDRIMGDYEDL